MLPLSASNFRWNEVDPTSGDFNWGGRAKDLIDGMNSLIDQQTQIFTAMMCLGLISP